MSLRIKSIIWLLSLLLMLTTITACNPERQEGREHIVQDETGMSSSMRTSRSSDEYPHTRALMEQPTRYIYYDVELIEQHPEGDYTIELPFDFPFSDYIDWGNQSPGEPTRQPQQPAPQQPTEHPTQPQQPAQPDRPNQQPEQPAEQPTQQPTESGISATEMQVIELTNAQRRQAGLPELQADAHLTQVAREKSSDMQRNRYFSHTSPTYGSPFDMMRDMGVSYGAAGENIAMGQRSPEEVVQAWMDSQGHRENILNASYTHIGVGYVENGHYWTQMFISK